MEFNNKYSRIYIPDKTKKDIALRRTTHLAIGAHPDDIEIMAFNGIEACYKNQDSSFTAAVITNGANSIEKTNLTEKEIVDLRANEQIKAADIGEYGALVMLGYSSNETKNKSNNAVLEDISNLIRITKPNIVYTHNLFDEHLTHLAVSKLTIEAIRSLPKDIRPKKVYGCEVWRGLDWLDSKVSLDVSNNPKLAKELIEVFASQNISKDYPKATLGRRYANATFNSSHKKDTFKAVTYAIDLTPLIQNDCLSILDYMKNILSITKENILNNLEELL